MVTSGNTGGPYFSGAILAYMCNTNFDSTNNPLMCMCDTTGTVPAWDCSDVNFSTTCRRSGYYTEFSAGVKSARLYTIKLF